MISAPPRPRTPACSPATGWPSSASGARALSRWTSRGDVRGCGSLFSARARVQRAYSGSPHFSHLLSNSPLSRGPLGYTGRKTCAQQTWHGGGGSAALPSVDGLRRARISSTSLARRLLMVRIAVSSCRARRVRSHPPPQCDALRVSSSPLRSPRFQAPRGCASSWQRGGARGVFSPSCEPMR